MKLIIKNFGPIKEGEIDLSKKLYIITGYNNSGKTLISKLLYYIFNDDNIENFSKKIIEKIDLNKNYQFQDLVYYLLSEYSKHIKNMFETTGNNFSFEVDIDEIKTVETCVQSWFTNFDILDKNSMIFLIKLLLKYPNSLSYVESNTDYEGFFDRIKFLYSTKKLNSNNFYNYLNSEVDKILKYKLMIDGFDVLFKSKKSNEILKLNQISSSSKNLSLFYLYFKYFTKETNNFLIIDNIENNLHPNTQVQLLNILYSFLNNNRLLITTNSSIVSDIISNWYNIAFLKEKYPNIDFDINLSRKEIVSYCVSGRIYENSKGD